MQSISQIKHALLVVVILVSMLVGCSSPPPAGPSSTDVAEGRKAKDELAAKLNAMPPDQRAEYVKQHPEEVNKIMRGTGLGMGSRNAPGK